MLLSQRCTHEFDSKTQNSGSDIASRGHVRTLSASAQSFETQIQGDVKHLVYLRSAKEFGKPVLHTKCTCADYVDGVLCAHVWASLLVADAHPEFVKSFTGTAPLECYHDSDLQSVDEDMEAWGLEAAPSKKGAAQKSQSWRNVFSSIENSIESETHLLSNAEFQKSKKLWYVLNADTGKTTTSLRIDLFSRDVRSNGDLGAWKPAQVSHEEVLSLEEQVDRVILSELLGSKPRETSLWQQSKEKFGSFVISPPLFDSLLPLLSSTGRWMYRRNHKEDGTKFQALEWDSENTWSLQLFLEPHTQKSWKFGGRFVSGNLSMDMSEPMFVLSSGVLLRAHHMCRVSLSRQEVHWVYTLRQAGNVFIPREEEGAWLNQYWSIPHAPRVSLPRELQWENQTLTPTPKLYIEKDSWVGSDELRAKFQFDYGSKVFGPQAGESFWPDPQNRKLVQRDLAFEKQTVDEIFKCEATYFRKTYDAMMISFPQTRLRDIVELLNQRNGFVGVEKEKLKAGGSFSMSVTSGIDWFEVKTHAQFHGYEIPLARLLAAAKKKETFIQLGDGSYALLPETWLKQVQQLESFGEITDSGVVFKKSQVAILNALLTEQPEVKIDEMFKNAREKMMSIKNLKPTEAPDRFSGILRDYQKEGLGWLYHLTDLGFGGCLADDMGLGKTIQVLAFLLDKSRSLKKPSLVIVPKSLVHNWIEESKKFTPDLKIAHYTGKERGDLLKNDPDYDVLIMTYGLMRLDIEKIRDVEWGVAVLDEAQNIKTNQSQTTKAARLIKAQYKLALSGTPVENHLGELGSIFDFLNPGMFGSSPILQSLSRKKGDIEEGTVKVLAKALQPFILRRTKSQVLKELPAKTEQTIICELEEDQMKEYQTLRAHYRNKVTTSLQEKGLARSKIHVLEALLRLRQAACHPGLIDQTRKAESSPKLEALLEQLDEVIESGNKALVFSQFTKHLAIVKHALDQRNIIYTYLDGQTKNRQEVVERFQTDPTCQVFLISLKAGGLGLNLTAAEYCFLLDPWWNPAVEAQAIDRAHRMGQTKNVCAYRFITKDTVEEKILNLQQHKRKLADSIITSEVGFLKSLSMEDLQSLFAL